MTSRWMAIRALQFWVAMTAAVTSIYAEEGPFV
jgi:hypothetical protein